MFYIKKDCLTHDIINKYSIAHTSSLFNKHPFAKIRIYSTDSKPLLVVVDSITIVSNQYARIIVNDSVKRMYMFIDYIETPQIVNSQLSSYERFTDSPTDSLLDGSIICIEEFTFKPVSELQQEFGGDFEQYVLQADDAVITAPENSFHHISVLTQCLFVGHKSFSEQHAVALNEQLFKKRRLNSEISSSELFTVSLLNNSIKSLNWRTQCCLVDVKEAREFVRKNSTDRGTCQRYLFRDKTMFIEVVAFNELQKTTSALDLKKVYFF